MMMEIVDKERDLLKKILDSYLSELRLEVAATKRSTLDFPRFCRHLPTST